jgi:hypothetical protein
MTSIVYISSIRQYLHHAQMIDTMARKLYGLLTNEENT